MLNRTSINFFFFKFSCLLEGPVSKFSHITRCPDKNFSTRGILLGAQHSLFQEGKQGGV